MKKIYFLLFAILFACVGCQWKLSWVTDDEISIEVERYDRIQSLYLTTGDFSALQQMNTDYPMQTRTLIEDVLKIGKVNDPEINQKYLAFYQDTVLQELINSAEQQYANMEDINKELTKGFKRLKEIMPDMDIPMVYAQIGALDQSIIVGNNTIGICIDKYLGANYPLYLKYYPADQRKLMVRSMIVPDCLTFYIMSKYPIPNHDEAGQEYCDIQVSKIFWLVNHIMQKKVFKHMCYVDNITWYMKKHKEITPAQLMNMPITIGDLKKR